MSSCRQLIDYLFEFLAGEWEFYKSMKENVAEIQIPSGEALTLIDYPGAERLRSHLFEQWLGKVTLFINILVVLIRIF